MMVVLAVVDADVAAERVAADYLNACLMLFKG